ncbi:MAG TPA: HD-GYP domain-containing protein [Ktedonobacteraceae bacterium]|nr:HD-GYP domain-containing protein [Ktedonobacteraceae bacterium]
MTTSMDRPGSDARAERDILVPASQEVNILGWALEQLRQLALEISLHETLPIMLATQNGEITREKQGKVVLAVQSLTELVHDVDTAEHVLRVMQLAEITAHQLAQPPEQLYLIRLAALLHDLGKIGIPDVILLKSEALTGEEWDIMRCHPDIGRQLLEQAGGIFSSVATIVGMHHERWDGRGYPRGATKDNIPLGARILAVVDAYDAMTSPRVYQKNPHSAIQARTELQRCAGSQFDPRVVEVFLKVIEHD